KLHAIVFSPPYQGHINPIVNLALKLASKGITTTFVNFRHVHHHQTHAAAAADDHDPFSRARASGLDVRYATMSDGFPLEFDRRLRLDEYLTRLYLHELPARADELVGRIAAEFGAPWINFLVADTAFFPVVDVARKFGIVAVSFWPQPALVFSLMYHLELLKANPHFPFKDEAEEEITFIPGISSINTKDLMQNLKESGARGVIPDIVSKAFEEVKKADFVLHNTVEEVEPEILAALNRRQPNYAVGPVNFFEQSPTISPVSKSLLPEIDCTDWLKSKPPGRVLYVSFGSFVDGSTELVVEIAHGLLLSGVHFVWSLRPGFVRDDGDADPFSGELNERGLVIPWCNQIKVLSDPAVGGFLTHNGWNSTVESVWCGVPMICYPVYFDQLPNRKLVVEEWKVGLNLSDGKSVDRMQVAEKIRTLFSSSNAEASSIRRRASQLKNTFRDAVGGSSERNFNRFVQDL
ncbi:hypothetical protein M569_06205, partial [Genlisea aurea]